MSDLETWANIIGGLFTAVGVVVALIAILWENRASRLTLSVDLSIKLWEKFDDTQMRIERRNASAALLDIIKGGTADPLKLNSVENILNFFELLGLLQKRGALDKDSTMVMFSYWHRFYWHAVSKPLHSSQRSYITTARTGNKLLWRHAQHLMSLMTHENAEFKLQDLKDFLINETKLTEKESK